MINQIFLDVDGVLADWSSCAIRLFDLDPETIHDSWPLGVYELATVLGVSQNEMWRRIHARPIVRACIVERLATMQPAGRWTSREPPPWALAGNPLEIVEVSAA